MKKIPLNSNSPAEWLFFSEDHDLPTKVNLFPSLVLKICRSWASVLKLVTRCGAWPGWFHHNKILICTSRSTRVPHIFGGWPGTPSQCDQGPRHVFGGGPWQRAWSLHHQGGLSRLGLAQKSWIDPKHHRYWYMIIWYVSVYIYICYICDIWYSYPTYLVCLWKLGIYSKNIRISLQGKWGFKPFWVEWGTIFSGTEPTWLRVSNSLNNLCLHAWMMSLFNWCEGWVEVNQIILEYVWMHVHIYVCMFLSCCVIWFYLGTSSSSNGCGSKL